MEHSPAAPGTKCRTAGWVLPRQFFRVSRTSQRGDPHSRPELRLVAGDRRRWVCGNHCRRHAPLEALLRQPQAERPGAGGAREVRGGDNGCRRPNGDDHLRPDGARGANAGLLVEMFAKHEKTGAGAPTRPSDTSYRAQQASVPFAVTRARAGLGHDPLQRHLAVWASIRYFIEGRPRNLWRMTILQIRSALFL